MTPIHETPPSEKENALYAHTLWSSFLDVSKKLTEPCVISKAIPETQVAALLSFTGELVDKLLKDEHARMRIWIDGAVSREYVEKTRTFPLSPREGIVEWSKSCV